MGYKFLKLVFIIFSWSKHPLNTPPIPRALPVLPRVLVLPLKKSTNRCTLKFATKIDRMRKHLPSYKIWVATDMCARRSKKMKSALNSSGFVGKKKIVQPTLFIWWFLFSFFSLHKIFLNTKLYMDIESLHPLPIHIFLWFFFTKWFGGFLFPEHHKFSHPIPCSL